MQDGKYITSAEVFAGIDMSLYLVIRIVGDIFPRLVLKTVESMPVTRPKKHASDHRPAQ